MLKIKDMNSNNVIRQGDSQPREYQLDTGNLNLNLANKQATIRLMTGDYKGIAYETTAAVSSENKISFSIDDIIPAREYRLEITVDDYVFPSRALDGQFNVDPSSHGQEVNIINVVGVDAVVRKAVDLINNDPGLIIDEDKLFSDIISNTSVGNIEEYYQQFNDVIAELSEEKGYYSLPEIVAARGGKPSLGAKIDEVTSQINNLVANAGDTDGNAELLDIRVGFDGITYPTAGEAVRALGIYLLPQDKQPIKLKNEIFDSGLKLGTEALKPSTSSAYEVSDGRLKVTGSGTYPYVIFEFQERFQEDDLGDLFYASIQYELKNPVNELRIRLIDQQLRITDEASLSLNQTHTLSVYERYERSNEMLTRPYGNARYGTIENATDSYYYISKPLLLNLTKIFGEGNEPTEYEIKDILLSMPDSWFEGETTVIRNIKVDEGDGKVSKQGHYDDVKVERIRDSNLDTTYFLTWINNETFSGGKIVPKVKITADNAGSTNIRNVRQFISDEGSAGREYEVVINAGIQMPNNIGDGLIISEGEILRDAPQETHLGQYALGINDEGELRAFPPNVSAQDILSEGYTNAVVAFVPLIENGEKVDQSIIEICPHWSQVNPRQVIGQFDNGDYIIMTVNGRLPKERGMTLPEMADILMNLGVHFAYNLDGGGSTQTFIKKKRINQDYNRTRPTLMTFERIV